MRTVNPEQHARRRAAILRAAAREFAAAGVDGASTSAICRRAKIGSGTLFHYFPTKRAIFLALFEDGLAGTPDVIATALALDPRAGIDRLVDHLVADFDDPLLPGLTAAALLQAQRDTEFALMLAADEERVRDALTTLLHRWADQGHALPYPPERAARWILRAIDGCYLAADGDDFDPEASRAEFRTMINWLLGSPEPEPDPRVATSGRSSSRRG